MKVTLTLMDGKIVIIWYVEDIRLGGDRTIFTRTFGNEWVAQNNVLAMEASFAYPGSTRRGK